MSVRPLRRRLAVQPVASGGYIRSETPDPNSGMATLERTQGAGQDNPAGQGQGLLLRGMASRAAGDYATSMAPQALGAPAGMLSGHLPGPWDGLLQALFEQGVGRIRANSASSQPGFFAQQNPNSLQRQALLEQLRVQDINAGRM